MLSFDNFSSSERYTTRICLSPQARALRSISILPRTILCITYISPAITGRCAFESELACQTSFTELPLSFHSTSPGRIEQAGHIGLRSQTLTRCWRFWHKASEIMPIQVKGTARWLRGRNPSEAACSAHIFVSHACSIIPSSKVLLVKAEKDARLISGHLF